MNTKWTQFQSTLLIRGATNCSRRLQRREKFQSTLLIRGATRFLHYKQKHRLFQSTLLIRGATLSVMSGKRYLSGFQSTLLIRGATGIPCCPSSRNNFNPRSSYEERPIRQEILRLVIHFNPRSSYEERQLHNRPRLRFCHFNPRSSYEERLRLFYRKRCIPGFQSTLLIRGATNRYANNRLSSYHFNPRSSYEERPEDFKGKKLCKLISIHAPHTRSDVRRVNPRLHKLLFQSTLLIRGATCAFSTCSM